MLNPAMLIWIGKIAYPCKILILPIKEAYKAYKKGKLTFNHIEVMMIAPITLSACMLVLTIQCYRALRSTFHKNFQQSFDSMESAFLFECIQLHELVADDIVKKSGEIPIDFEWKSLWAPFTSWKRFCALGSAIYGILTNKEKFKNFLIFLSEKLPSRENLREFWKLVCEVAYKSWLWIEFYWTPYAPGKFCNDSVVIREIPESKVLKFTRTFTEKIGNLFGGMEQALLKTYEGISEGFKEQPLPQWFVYALLAVTVFAWAPAVLLYLIAGPSRISFHWISKLWIFKGRQEVSIDFEGSRATIAQYPKNLETRVLLVDFPKTSTFLLIAQKEGCFEPAIVKAKSDPTAPDLIRILPGPKMLMKPNSPQFPTIQERREILEAVRDRGSFARKHPIIFLTGLLAIVGTCAYIGISVMHYVEGAILGIH